MWFYAEDTEYFDIGRFNIDRLSLGNKGRPQFFDPLKCSSFDEWTMGILQMQIVYLLYIYIYFFCWHLKLCIYNSHECQSTYLWKKMLYYEHIRSEHPLRRRMKKNCFFFFFFCIFLKIFVKPLFFMKFVRGRRRTAERRSGKEKKSIIKIIL